MCVCVCSLASQGVTNELVWGGGCTTEADSKGEASEVVSMETDLQRIRNKGKRKSTEMSAVLSISPAVFLESAPKRSKSSKSLSQ